jgi:hypothetical protein
MSQLIVSLSNYHITDLLAGAWSAGHDCGNDDLYQQFSSSG